MVQIQENLKRGTIELIILSMLKDDDMYGYQVVHELFTRSHGLYLLQEGSMYPSLYRLLQKGYISDYKQLVGKKRTRVYYHLEPSGREYLEVLLKEYNTITEGIYYVINYVPEVKEEKEEAAN